MERESTFSKKVYSHLNIYPFIMVSYPCTHLLVFLMLFSRKCHQESAQFNIVAVLLNIIIQR